VLVPEGLFAPPSPGTEERATFLALPPPTDEEVELLLRTVAGRVVRLLKRLGRLDEDAFPQDALQALQAASIQRRLPFPRDDERPPPRKRRCAFLLGGRSAPTPACAGRFPSAPYRTRRAPFAVHRALHR
jgi:hypothetical protein